MRPEEKQRLSRNKARKLAFLKHYGEHFVETEALFWSGISRAMYLRWRSKDAVFAADCLAVEYKRYDAAWRLLQEAAGITPRQGAAPIKGVPNAAIKSLLAIVRTDPRYQTDDSSIRDSAMLPVKIEIKGLDSKRLDAVFAADAAEPASSPQPQAAVPVKEAPPQKEAPAAETPAKPENLNPMITGALEGGNA